MKQIKLLAILLFFSGVMVLYNGCKDKCPVEDVNNPDCDSYDPCYGKKEINTFFRVRPGDGGWPPPHEVCKLLPSDTFNFPYVRFDIPVGNPDNSEYSWQIGSEAEPRRGNGFEIDFGDYLNQVGQEIHIPMTLTIRTPLNECLTNPSDTLIVVQRNIYFTSERFVRFLVSPWKDSIHAFRGFLAHEPNVEKIIKFFNMKGQDFRGVSARSFDLISGIPIFDTIWRSANCVPIDPISCGNFKHVLLKFPEDRRANCHPEATGRLLKIEIIRLSEKDRKFIFEFLRPGEKNLIFEFTGQKI